MILRDALRVPLFAAGGHSAILAKNYPPIVNYILGLSNCKPDVECEAYELPSENRTSKRWWLANLFYRFSVLLWLAAIMLIGWLAYGASRLVRGKREHTALGLLVRRALAGGAVVGFVIVVLRYV